MYREDLTFRCCALLLIIVSLVSQTSSTSADKKNENSTVQCELDGNAKRNCDEKAELARINLHKNATKHNNDMLYEFAKFMRNNSDGDGSLQYELVVQFLNYLENYNLMDLQAYFTKVNSENNSNNGTDSTKHIVPYKMCHNITCIQLCCPLGNRLVDEDCIAGENEYVFPNVYGYSNDLLQSENKKVDELFQLIVRSPCQKTKRFLLNTNDSDEYHKYMFYTNGSLYLPYFDLFVEPTSYCLAVVDHDQFDAIVCSKSVDKIIHEKIEIVLNDFKSDIIKEILSNFIILLLSYNIISMLCALIIFLVYSLLRELHNNTHSFMIRRFSSLMFMGDLINLLSNIFDAKRIYSICVTNALIAYFFFMASSFWLTLMNFDMWWTFRDFCILQRKAERQRKKLIYSILAWGGPFILTIICAIMEFVPNVPENFRPGFGVHICWFSYDSISDRLYFYGPEGICIITSICFSIHTALIITRYEKKINRQLRNVESQCFNDKKKWFALYLKLYNMLFIISAIQWIIFTVMKFWLVDYNKLVFVIYSLFLMNTMEKIGIFIIFVCKKTIIRLLLKRLFQNREFVPRTLTRRVEHQHAGNNFPMKKYQVQEGEPLRKGFVCSD